MGSYDELKEIVHTLVLSFMPATEVDIQKQLAQLGIHLELSEVDNMLERLANEERCWAIPCADDRSALYITKENSKNNPEIEFSVTLTFTRTMSANEFKTGGAPGLIDALHKEIKSIERDAVIERLCADIPKEEEEVDGDEP